MFESLQKMLLNKAMDKPKDKKKKGAKSKTGKKAKAKIKPQQDADIRSDSRIALDDAIDKLENSGVRMDDMLAKNEELLAEVKREAARKMTPERRALIDSAMKVRKAKQDILNGLDDETRARLYLTAIKAFGGK
ncbi:hypothetical protein [Terasakiella sp. SH-1]|uniref:hypothetical protein n=1 Tax=Terasakiella sp. SH-1 TaxID=2560057 RepID=UPI0010748642|nr:hypothetical protein [Terasakiella sp. SH-1]